MLSVRYSLRDKKSKKKTLIRMSTSFNGQRFVLCTRQSILPEYWDNEKGLPKQIKGSNEIKNVSVSLKDLDVKVNRLYDNLSSNGSQKVQAEIFKQKTLQLIYPDKYTGENVNKTTVVDFMNLVIKHNEEGVRLKDNQYKLEENSIKPYRTTRNHFIEFQKQVNRTFLLTDINQQLHDEFSSYIIDDLGYSKNTHSKYIMTFSQMVKYAVKLKLITSSILNDIEFNTSREETDNIYLDTQEIQYIMDLKEFKNKGEEIVRDLFVIGCYTGLRFSNYKEINLDYVKDGLLTTIQIKTKKKVTIPIHKNVQNIIDKYKGVLPKCPTNQEFNITLKAIGKRIPELSIPFTKQITRNRVITVEETMKWENLATHTGRRSFCTNMYLLKVPILTIMSCSGHKTEKSFRTYIKAGGLEHAQIMKSFWDETTTKDHENETK